MENSIAKYNKDANISKLCRTCLTDRGDMKSLLKIQENVNYSAIEILESFIPMKFEQNPDLPCCVCSACFTFIDEINRFKQRCLLTDATLRARLNDRNDNCKNGTAKRLEEVKVVEGTQRETKAELLNLVVFDEDKISYGSDSDEILSKTVLNRNNVCKKIKNAIVIQENECNKVLKSKMYVCKYCDDFTSRFKWEYMQHRKTKHGKVKRKKSSERYTCVHCDYVTHVKTNLATHYKTHFGDKPFCCEFCKFKTNFRASLQAHIRIHTGEKPFLCDKCDLRFKQLAHLKQHRLTHSDKRPWPCNRCEYKAKAKRHLDNHLRTHTGEKPFMCDQCSFTCANHVNLLSHKRSHSVEKMFKCSLCQYASNFKKNLSMHVAKHSGVKAFECGTCEYRGTCSQNLKAHMISHSQERPFGCEVCSYRTKTNSMLNKHMKTHVR